MSPSVSPRRSTGTARSVEPPLLDDADGCRAVGGPCTLSLLRRLLRLELLREAPLLRPGIRPSQAAPVLHRWSSACAYCGATRLRDRVERWRADLRADAPHPRPGDFDHVVAATCAAIEARMEASS